MMKKLISIVVDLLGIVGAGLIVNGCFILHESIGYLVGGGMLLLFAIRADRKLTVKTP